MNIEKTLEERGKTHGDFCSDGAPLMQGLKHLVRNSPNYPRMMDHQREALDMILHKIGRICVGDPDSLEHWIDIIGYSQLVISDLEAE